MSDLASRLVHAAENALEASDRYTASDYSVEARAAVAAVLRELDNAGYLVIRGFEGGGHPTTFAKVASELEAP